MRIQATVEHDALSAPAELTAFRSHEGLSELFDLDLSFLHPDPDLDLDAFIWSQARVALTDLDTGESTTLVGIVEEADALAQSDDRFLYRLRLRPRLNGLAYRVRSRIFQDLDVKGVVQQVFTGAGIPDSAVQWKLARTYAKRELCVQYKESELALVQRLFEQEGIFFLFEHGDDGDVLIVGDDPSVLAQAGETPELPLLTEEGADGVTDAVVTTRVGTENLEALDWNWQAPDGPIGAVAGDRGPLGLSRTEYPGGFADPKEGGWRYRDRLDAAQVEQNVLTARSDRVSLRPGSHFTLAGAFAEALCVDYLVLSLDRNYDATSTERAYTSTFQAMVGDNSFRPLRRTPWPRVHGKESAVVTGPPGEEIHVDEYGRVKVHLYWDREGKVDDHASCWMRVQQNNTSGSMLLPRVGWEVTVAFLDGDPDRPVVLQKLYNQETMPPYPLPDNHSQMALQSSSSPGGGGTNEVRMQDGSGGMEFSIHASKDMSTAVGNDLTEEVTVDSHHEVGQSLTEFIGADETHSVGANWKASLAAAWTEATVGDKSVKVGAMDDWGVKGDHNVIAQSTWNETVSGVMNVMANEVAEHYHSSHKRTVGAAMAMNTVTDLIDETTGAKTELVGGAKVELITHGKQEVVNTAKALTAGLLITKVGGDVTIGAKGAVMTTVGGAWAENVGEAFTAGGRLVRLTAPAGITFKVGSTELSGSGTSLKIKASSLSVKGGPELKLKGKIDFKE